MAVLMLLVSIRGKEPLRARVLFAIGAFSAILWITIYATGNDHGAVLMGTGIAFFGTLFLGLGILRRDRLRRKG
jgi:hypothetical protein